MLHTDLLNFMAGGKGSGVAHREGVEIVFWR